MDDLGKDLSVNLSSFVGRQINYLAPIIVNIPPVHNPGDPPPIGDDPTWDPNATPIGGFVDIASKNIQQIKEDLIVIAVSTKKAIALKSNAFIQFIKKMWYKFLNIFKTKKSK